MIWIWIFFGLLFGALVGYILFLFKRYKQRQSAIKRINQQNIKFTIDGKSYDLQKQVERKDKRELSKREQKKIKKVEEEMKKKQEALKKEVKKREEELKKLKGGI